MVALRDLPPMLPPGIDSKDAPGLDAFWHQWASGSTATWTSFEMADRLHRTTGAPMPSRMHSRHATLNFVLEPARRERLLSILGALDSFHVLSAQQLAFWTQDPRLATGNAADLRALFSLGLVDVGCTSMLRGAESLTLYRLADTTVWEQELAPSVTLSELISVTGGLPLSKAHRFDRHDSVLATFIARCAAWLPEIHAVFGEKYGSHELLLSSAGAKRPPKVSPLAAVDAVIVRDDGAIVLVELQASDPGPRFAEKLTKLAEILQLNPRLSLLVLTLPRHVGAGRPDHTIASGARSSIVKALRSDPQQMYGGVAERMFQADWVADFFPTPDTVDVRFLRLNANRYDPRLDTWRQAEMLDASIDGIPFPLEFEDNPEAAIPIVNSLLLRQTPTILRDRVRPLYSMDIPALWHQPSHPDTPFDLLPRGRGALADTRATVPRRLRNLDDRYPLHVANNNTPCW
jgi:hypothetical protein